MLKKRDKYKLLKRLKSEKVGVQGRWLALG
jgi:hypothetical protein